MKTIISYKGTQNGINGVWCGHLPKDVIVTEEITVYRADKGKMFFKDNKYYPSIIQKDGVNIEDYEEVEAPGEEEIPEE